MSNSSPYKYIDIFAGCGGLSLGFYNSGWKGIFAVEKNKTAFETLKHNLILEKNHFQWPNWLQKGAYDIDCLVKGYKSELIGLQEHVDLVAGGPPCQGFSLAGRRKKEDTRNKLVDSYVEFIRWVKPKIIFFENVKGFTVGFTEKEVVEEPYSNYIVQQLQKIGYKVHYRIINFSDYGIPQSRKRFILIGMKEGDPNELFDRIVLLKDKFLKEKGLDSRCTVSDAISDLERRHGETPSLDKKNFKNGIYGPEISAYQSYLKNGCLLEIPDSHRFANHKEATLDKFKYFLDNCKNGKQIDKKTKTKFNTDKNCIVLLDSNSPCPTLTTLPDDYVHYSEPRILTVREYARIQSFNDWYEFKGCYTTGGLYRKKDVPRYSQVGNAIPPLFVELVGTVMKGWLDEQGA